VSALSFLATMCVTLVLRCERPRLWGRTKEHLGDFYPITAIATCEKCFELVAATEERGAVVDPGREVFEKPNGDVAILEGQRLTEVTARGVDPDRISSKVAFG